MTQPRDQSLAHLFLRRVAASPDRDAFLYPTDSGWRRVTWRDVGEQVRAVACGLRALGVHLEERCAILSATRLEWVIADLGILCAGGATTTIYPSHTGEECAYILGDAQCVVAIVENTEHLAKLARHRPELPQLGHVILLDGSADSEGVTTLSHVMEAGRAWDRAHPGAYEARIDQLTPTHLATLLYTSGTTGMQKGVELLHDCWLYEAEASEGLGLFGEEDVQYLWLPLSHSFGKVLVSAQLRLGFVSAIDGRVDTLVDNLGEVRPTFVAAVPRVFEKVRNRVVMGAQEVGGWQLKIFDWAFRTGRQVSALRQRGRQPTGWLALRHRLADRLVFSKLRERFGGRLRFFVSGSAPLSREVAEFFHAAGLLILEGYGLTETSAACVVNRLDRYKFGTVGVPVPGTEIRIAPKDGEILIRGRGVMRGYHRLEAETRDALDAEGWCHTGDIGTIDGDGFLTITDRKKDLIKTSGGQYVAPQAVEGKIKARCPYVAHIVLVGNTRRYCSALLTLDEEAVGQWLSGAGVAEKLTMAQLAQDARVIGLIQGYLDAVNATLARYATVKRFAILPTELSVENGLLTASLKVRRTVVEQTYEALLDDLYDDTPFSPSNVIE